MNIFTLLVLISLSTGAKNAAPNNAMCGVYAQDGANCFLSWVREMCPKKCGVPVRNLDGRTTKQPSPKEDVLVEFPFLNLLSTPWQTPLIAETASPKSVENCTIKQPISEVPSAEILIPKLASTLTTTTSTTLIQTTPTTTTIQTTPIPPPKAKISSNRTRSGEMEVEMGAQRWLCRLAPAMDGEAGVEGMVRSTLCASVRLSGHCHLEFLCAYCRNTCNYPTCA